MSTVSSAGNPRNTRQRFHRRAQEAAETILGFVRDHLIPRAAGGPDHHDNRVASCAVCDRLKADAVVGSLTEARAVVAQQREHRAVWFDRVREAVRAVAPSGSTD